jgi:hypothetical protein
MISNCDEARRNGGPAFPSFNYITQENRENPQGMTLRDYFAAKAMQSIIDQQDAHRGEVDSAAWMAYRMADAMMEARK